MSLPRRSPVLLLTVLITLLVMISCGRGTVSETEMLRQAELFGSRSAFLWQNTTVFQMRGSCRLEDAGLVARGPFVLWGSAVDTLLRGDFYGPDGGPVVSLMADRYGMTVYLPEEEYALFTPAGLSAGAAVLPTIDLIHMLRTGFPMVLEPWMISEGAVPDGGMVSWSFTAPGAVEDMILTLEHGSLFPSTCSWSDGELRITAASPHDEYSAWPWKWETDIAGKTVELELTQVNTDVVPWEGIWSLTVPVAIDTATSAPTWGPAWQIDVR